MELPKVTILTSKDIDNPNHLASLKAQDYPGCAVREVQDLNADIQTSDSEFFVLTKYSHLLRKDCVSQMVAALLEGQGSTHIVYSDLIFVENGIQFYSPQHGYDKIDFLNSINSFQDCFAFSKALWHSLEGFKPSPHPVYSFLLRAANHTIFTHIAQPLFYSYTSNIVTDKNTLFMAKQAL